MDLFRYPQAFSCRRSFADTGFDRPPFPPPSRDGGPVFAPPLFSLSWGLFFFSLCLITSTISMSEAAPIPSSPAPVSDRAYVPNPTFFFFPCFWKSFFGGFFFFLAHRVIWFSSPCPSESLPSSPLPFLSRKAPLSRALDFFSTRLTDRGLPFFAGPLSLRENPGFFVLPCLLILPPTLV